MAKNILLTSALSLAVFLVAQAPDVKTTDFTYTEENNETERVKQVIIWNQAADSLATGLSSPESEVVPNKKYRW